MTAFFQGQQLMRDHGIDERSAAALARGGYEVTRLEESYTHVPLCTGQCHRPRRTCRGRWSSRGPCGRRRPAVLCMLDNRGSNGRMKER